MSQRTVLEIESLSIRYVDGDEIVPVVHDVSLQVAAGECVGVVGESGAGKSQSFLALLGLLSRSARVSGRARIGEVSLLGASASVLDTVRGARVGMIFQDPMTSLTPHRKIGRQIAETLEHHRGTSRETARARALDLLRQVQVPDPERRLDQYPHELSGGLRQRVMIAIALACDPELLIADEPTTALDVTIQAQVLAVLARAKDQRGLALVLVSHDLGVIAGLADRIAVMYAGRIVELGAAATVLRAPAHPYTAALLASLPRMDGPTDAPLAAIPGQPPNPRAVPSGCAFHPRCPRAIETCRSVLPTLEQGVSSARACHRPLDVGPHSGATT